MGFYIVRFDLDKHGTSRWLPFSPDFTNAQTILERLHDDFLPVHLNVLVYTENEFTSLPLEPEPIENNDDVDNYDDADDRK